MNFAQSKGKLSNLKRFFRVLGNLVSTYLGMILTIGFLVPFILGAIKIHNYNEITSFIEVFVLVSATLSLLSFTYIMALTDMHEKVKESMIRSGELFFMSTVQFIVGLFLLFLMDYLTHSFLNISNIHLNPDIGGIASIVIFLIQIFVLLELIFAVSKFFRGVMGVYISFRAKNLRESIFYLLSWRGKDG
jgi:membrane-bound acyltransferase YfiQ involved in biofilm formation